MKFDWNKVIGITGLLLTCIALVITCKGIQITEDIAMKSGAYEKPKTVLLLGNKILSQDETKEITFGLNAPDNAALFVRLPLVLKNDGEKALKNVSITLRYPNKVNMAVSNEYISTNIEGPFFKEYKRKFHSFGNFDYISIYLENINPGQSIHIGDVFSLKKTVINDVFSVPGSNEKYSLDVFYSIGLLVTISSEGERQKDFKVNVCAVESKNMNELKDKYLEHLSREATQQRLNTGFIDYFFACLRSKEKSDILIYPHHNVISVPKIEGAKLYFPTANPRDDEISIASYKLFLFSRLFVFK